MVLGTTSSSGISVRRRTMRNRAGAKIPKKVDYPQRFGVPEMTVTASSDRRETVEPEIGLRCDRDLFL
jgi:hypothetical protein